MYTVHLDIISPKIGTGFSMGRMDTALDDFSLAANYTRLSTIS